MNANKCLYVGNIPYAATQEEIKERMEEYGPIAEIKIFQRQGYGFVTYETEENSTTALEDFNGKFFKGRQIKVARAKYGFTKPDDDRKCTHENRIYVGNIPYICEEDDIKTYFSTFGEVEDVQLIRSHKDKALSRGFAFVTFKTFENAQNAIKNAQGSVLQGRKIKVSSAHDKVDYQQKREDENAYYNYYYWHMYQMYNAWKQMRHGTPGSLRAPRRPGNAPPQPFERYGLAPQHEQRRQYKNIRNYSGKISKATKSTMKN